MLDVVWLGEAVHLFVHSKQLLGGMQVKLLLTSDEILMFPNHKKKLFMLIEVQAQAAVVLVSSGVLSAYGGGACMAECITEGRPGGDPCMIVL